MLSFTTSRRLRRATPQVENLENIVSLSTVQINAALLKEVAVRAHAQQVEVATQGNANNGSAVVQTVAVVAFQRS